MRMYFDSSILVRLYIAEPGGESTLRFFESLTEAVLINPLQELEVRNSLRQKVMRREISEGEVVRAMRMMDDDFVQGRLFRKPVEWTAVFSRAEELSRKCSPKKACRAFDLMHVAIASVSSVKEFVTADQDQARLAKFAGMRVTVF